MTTEHVAQVWQNSPYSSTRLLIHLTLAEYADSSGRFYASQKAIAERSRCTVEYIRTTVKEMVEDGYLIIEKKGSSLKLATRYKLLLPQEVGEIQNQPPNTTPYQRDDYMTVPLVTTSYGSISTNTNNINIDETPNKHGESEEYTEMPWPMFEDEPQIKSTRKRVHTEDETGAVGKLPVDKAAARQEKYGAKPKPDRNDKPEAEWTTKDLVAEFYELTDKHSKGAPSQVNAGYLATWINKHVGQGISRETILGGIRMFFGDPRNTVDPGVGYPFWRRFMAYYPTIHGRIDIKIEIDQATLDMVASSKAKFLREMEA
jgi:hypothetical protein